MNDVIYTYLTWLTPTADRRNILVRSRESIPTKSSKRAAIQVVKRSWCVEQKAPIDTATINLHSQDGAANDVMRRECRPQVRVLASSRGPVYTVGLSIKVWHRSGRRLQSIGRDDRARHKYTGYYITAIEKGTERGSIRDIARAVAETYSVNLINGSYYVAISSRCTVVHSSRTTTNNACRDVRLPKQVVTPRNRKSYTPIGRLTGHVTTTTTPSAARGRLQRSIPGVFSPQRARKEHRTATPEPPMCLHGAGGCNRRRSSSAADDRAVQRRRGWHILDEWRRMPIYVTLSGWRPTGRDACASVRLLIFPCHRGQFYTCLLSWNHLKLVSVVGQSVILSSVSQCAPVGSLCP